MKNTSGVLTVLMLGFLLQGCSKFEVEPAKVPKVVVADRDPTPSAPTFADKVKLLNWITQYVVLNPRGYNYSVEYKINFEAKTFVIDVEKGDMVTATLPAPTMKSLSDSQILQIRNLIAQITYQACNGDMLLGGGRSTSISFWTDPTAVADFDIYGQPCGGSIDPNAREATGGFEALTSYMSSL